MLGNLLHPELIETDKLDNISAVGTDLWTDDFSKYVLANSYD